MSRAPAPAKINLALVVGPLRDDGKHEVTTILQRVALVDRIELSRAPTFRITGFDGDTLVRDALSELAAATATPLLWRVDIEKQIPVAGGLGGGSSDAATALRLANAELDQPLPPHELHAVAARVGADVPFFLHHGPQLGEGDGTELSALDLPQDYFVVLVLPRGVTKRSTADVYASFDGRAGSEGYPERRDALRRATDAIVRARDLAALPPNDLAASPIADRLRDLGAFRADVSGAGPVVYGLFLHRNRADVARRTLRGAGRTWLTVPAWYG